MQMEQAKAMNPLIEMFGASDPAFFSGHYLCLAYDL